MHYFINFFYVFRCYGFWKTTGVDNPVKQSWITENIFEIIAGNRETTGAYIPEQMKYQGMEKKNRQQQQPNKAKQTITTTVNYK